MAPKKETHPDWWLLTTSLALLFLGVFVVFSASFARAGQASSTGLDMFFYLKRQSMWAVLALGALGIGMRLHYYRLRPWWLVLTGVAAILLVVVLIPGIGIEANGSRRWLGVGQARLQPSEFAKVALVVFLAAYAAKRRGAIKDPVHGLGPALAVLAVLGALIAIEDLGTAASLAFTGVLMLHMAGARKRHLAALVAAGALLFCVFVMHKEYRRDRVTAFVNPFTEKAYNGAGYQPAHSLIALGSGGWSGKGIGRGREKFLYLPAEHTDYIFATIGEEMGLIGSLGVLVGFVLLVVRGLTIAHRTRDRFGSLLAAGLTCMIGVQAILNVAVVTSSIPATGVPLPFISYGGSSLVFVMLAVGMILNVSQYPTAVSAAEPKQERTPAGTRVRTARSGAAAPVGRHRSRERRATSSGR
jgi:cell division protein FtsW